MGLGNRLESNLQSLRKCLSGRPDSLHDGHDFSRELIDPGSFVGGRLSYGVGGRLSRFVLNDDVSARITVASSVEPISSSNECFACDISGLREARVRERRFHIAASRTSVKLR